MLQRCPQCQGLYDDTYRWILCNAQGFHNPIEVAWDAPYCRKHDFYDCKICKEEKPVKPKK